MRRRRQVIAAAVALRALQQAHKPAPPPATRAPVVRSVPPVERVERVVTERIVEPAGPDLSGPLAAVDKRSRRALEAVEEVRQGVDEVASKIEEIAGSFKDEISALREEIERPSPEPVVAPVVQPEPAPPIDAPTREEMRQAIVPLAQEFESLRGELRQRVTGLSRIAEEAKSDARHATAVAANAMSRDIPQPPALPDFLVGAAIHNGHLLGVMHSGKTKDFGQVVFKPRVISGGGRASSKQVQEWETQSSGGGDVLLTYAEPTQATVGAVAANIVASASATFRRVTIALRNDADTGIYLNPAGTATSLHFLLQPGGSRSYDTNQAISAIRAGGSDVTADVQVGTGA